MNHKLLTKAALAAALSLTTAYASATTTLRFSHFWPATSAIHKEVFQAWADDVEKASNGELKVQLFPSQTLTKADAAYQGAVNGISDIAATAQGYTAGRFPLTQVVELPGVSLSATQGGCITQSLYDKGMLADEYKDSHVLFMFSTGPGYIHTTDKEVKVPDDLKGLRIRRPSAVVGKILTELGAQPIGMPAPEIYSSMQRGLLDGVSLPWEGMKTFRLNELSNQHTQVPFYSLVFVATMNKKTYDRLPDNLKKVIDEHSGLAWSKKAGEVFDAEDKAGRAEAKGNIVEINDPLNDPSWGGPLNAAIKDYLGDLKAKNGQAVYDEALALRSQCAM
ncbi:C4-dicarboxylate ABC transporter substrate-binding protein [Pokkaliibacter plantistimulans]|uniref:C4-dicarboxylate ABC transporter substrate-binding protein n=1 Tax=Pokkaliibacter plantistimulans TaxID=1635171 RepID=A0ABX5LZC6_9GAMM|nr:TRAP transporter substrate-binding protein [Pokkaliibacter plantistimulans]PXF31666.1 C4-dicarboxylate ABC transporter substrate-binding protein [Pokkaliibacter plantistimulans]